MRARVSHTHAGSGVRKRQHVNMAWSDDYDLPDKYPVSSRAGGILHGPKAGKFSRSQRAQSLRIVDGDTRVKDAWQYRLRRSPEKDP